MLDCTAAQTINELHNTAVRLEHALKRSQSPELTGTATCLLRFSA